MSWMGFALVGVMVVTLQVTVAPYCQWEGIRPDWVLAIVVLYAVFGRGPSVLVGAWLLGLAVDWHSLERLGLAAMSYLLVALAVSRLRLVFPLYLPLAYAATTFAAGWGVQLLWWLYRLIQGQSAALPPWGMGAGAALYTSIFALGVYFALRPAGRLLGLRFPRRIPMRDLTPSRRYV